MTVTRSWTAIWMSIVVLGGASGCVYYMGDEDGAAGAGGGGDVALPLPPSIPEPPPVSGSAIQDCAYGGSTWRAEQRGEPTLYLAGLYETRSDHAYGYHPEGEARVEISLPGSNVLALSAYEPTHWIVDVAPGAALEKVVAIGYHAQRVTAPPGVTVEVHDHESMNSPLAACGHSLPYDDGGCDTDELIANVEEITGLPLAGFDGCYRATRLVYQP